VSDRIDVTATIRATDQASAAIHGIERSLQGLTHAAEGVGHAFHSISHFGAFGGLAHNFQHLGGALSHVAHGFHAVLEPLAAIAGIAGGFSLEKAFEGYVESAEHLDRMSKTLGTTADQLGAYEFAAQKAGVETESFDKSMQFAQRNMRKGAFNLDPKQAGLFKKMGIDLGAFRAGTKSAFDYLPQISEAMKAQHTSAARAAIAFAIFGRAGGAMIPFLLQGKEAIHEQTQEYLHQDHITKESAKNAVEFGHKQKDLVRTFMSMRDAVGNAVIPVLTEALGTFQAFLNDPKIRGEIIKELTGAFKALAEGLKEFKWREFYEGIKETLSWIKQAVAWVGGWGHALLILAAIMNAPVIAAILEVGVGVAKLGFIFGQLLVQGVALASRSLLQFIGFLGGGFVKGIALAARGLTGLGVLLSRGLVTALATAGRAVLAFGAMLLTTPLGWILAAIAAIAFAAYEIYENWDTIGPWFWRQWDTVKRAFSAAWDWVKSWIPQFVPDAIQAAWETLGSWFSTAWAAVQTAFSAVVTWLAGWIPQFVPDAIMAAWNTLGSWFGSAWDVVKAEFSSAWSWVQSWITKFLPDAIMAAWGTLGGWFAAAWAGVQDAFTATTTWLAGWIPSFVPALITDVWNTLGEAFTLIWTTAQAVFTAASTFLTQWLPQFIPDPILKAWDGLTAFFDRMWSGITGIFDRAWGHISPIINAISGFASTIGGGLSGALNYVGLGGGPTPAPAGPGPIWNPNNPVGAESLTPPPAPPPSVLNTPTGTPGAPGASGSVKVDVNIAGAPPGSTVSTKATGSVTPDVGTSMSATP
jgi:hypothetical protein